MGLDLSTQQRQCHLLKEKSLVWQTWPGLVRKWILFPEGDNDKELARARFGSEQGAVASQTAEQFIFSVYFLFKPTKALNLLAEVPLR